MGYQITRGVSQSLYKYLPESWIDFPVRGNMRYNYIAHVVRWNSEKLDGINKRRLIRVVNQSVKSFDAKASSGSGSGTSGFGTGLTTENCEILCPKHNGEERGVVAEISPLTFYCPECHKVYQFKSAEQYMNHRRCSRCKLELKQFRQIYFCKCGYATDSQPAYCKVCNSSEHITWSGKLGDYFFRCKKCGQKIPMRTKCKQCGEMIDPKVALDPSQYFAYNLSLIDIIDEKVESFLSDTDYGSLITIAYWLGKISREELVNIIENGITTDQNAVRLAYDNAYNMFVSAGLSETDAAIAAQAMVNKQCGSKYTDMIADLRGSVFTSPESLNRIAESLLEYLYVNELKDCSTLEDAVDISRMLNTNATPEEYARIAENYAISAVRVCGDIPFISCAYGYTRAVSEPEDGVVLHAFKEENPGTKNIYASKLKTEGVLFEFDRVRILSWLDKNGFVDHDLLPDLSDENEVKLWFVNNIKPDIIEPFAEIDKNQAATYYIYNLIHSLSHLLIRSAAGMCGLDKNSISEYIFPSIPAVLVYCQNSQGFSLGALFNLFEAYFDKWINTSFADAQKCIFDPICIERHKACSGCLFLNEVSCQHFNHDLDRTLVIGHVDRATGKKTFGFWEE